MSNIEPVCLGIILCDQVIEDKRTNKKSLIGTFNDIIVSKLPAKHPCMYLVVYLTNCRYENGIEIELSRDTDQGGEKIISMKGRVQGRNPLDVIDLVFEMHGVPLTGYGKYTIDVLVTPEQHRAAQRPFYVRRLPGVQVQGREE